MYYAEKVIDGRLHYRTTPDGFWQPLGPVKLTELLLEARARICQLEDDVSNAEHGVGLLEGDDDEA